MSRRDTRAAFTTLGVPVFFALVYAVTLAAGLPLALLFSPLLLRLALVIVPPPSRLTLPTCPSIARCEAETARREAVRRGEWSPQPAPVFDPDQGGVVWKGRYLMPAQGVVWKGQYLKPDRVYVLAIAPAAAPGTTLLASRPRPTGLIAAPATPAPSTPSCAPPALVVPSLAYPAPPLAEVATRRAA